MSRKYLHTPEECGDHDFDVDDTVCIGCGTSYFAYIESETKAMHATIADLREKTADAKRLAANAMAERDELRARLEMSVDNCRTALTERDAAIARAEESRRQFLELEARVSRPDALDYIDKLGGFDKSNPQETAGEAIGRHFSAMRARAEDAERARDELANLVGQAICMFTLAPGETIVDPIPHALTSGIESLLARAHANADTVAQLRLSERVNRRLAKELAEERSKTAASDRRWAEQVDETMCAEDGYREAVCLLLLALRTGLAECERLRGQISRVAIESISCAAKYRVELAESQAREARLREYAMNLRFALGCMCRNPDGRAEDDSGARFVMTDGYLASVNALLKRTVAEVANVPPPNSPESPDASGGGE